jgi:hypothetical protein
MLYLQRGMRPLIPLEIVDRIVSWVPNSSQQRTTEMLRLAGISVSWAVGWRHLVVHSHQQLLELLLLNTLLSDSLSLIHSVSLLAWKLADNQLLVNFLIPTTPSLRIINLLIGPTFAPDHLHEILATPKPSLQLLSLRFNQNTSRRSCQSVSLSLSLLIIYIYIYIYIYPSFLVTQTDTSPPILLMA